MNGGLVNLKQGIRLTGSQPVPRLSGFIRCRADSAWPAPPIPSSPHASRTGGLCDCLSTVTAPTAHDSDQRTGLIPSHSKPLLSPSPSPSPIRSSIPATPDQSSIFHSFISEQHYTNLTYSLAPLAFHHLPDSGGTCAHSGCRLPEAISIDLPGNDSCVRL